MQSKKDLILDCTVMDEEFPFKYMLILSGILQRIRSLEAWRLGNLANYWPKEVIKRRIENACAG